MKTAKNEQAIKVSTQIKAGGTSVNDNPLAVRGLKVKTKVKAGAEPPDRSRIVTNHNQTAVCGGKVKLKWAALGTMLLMLFCVAASTTQAQTKEPYQYQMTDDLNYDNSGKPVPPQVFKLPLPAPGKVLVVENVNIKIRVPQGQNCLCTMVTESPRVPSSEPSISMTMPSVLAFHEYGPSGLDVRVVNQAGPLYVQGNQASDDFFVKCERSSPVGYGQIRVTVIGYVMDAPQR